jgi:PS-10 peptidase S37.
VLEFPFALWQWGTNISIIPDLKKATDEELFNTLLKVSGPDYFSEEKDSSPFFVQAAKELGYYGYDTKPFKDLLSIKSSKNYLHHIFLPQSQEKNIKFDKYLYKKTAKFLKKTKEAKMLFIYGEYDPWSAVMPVAPVKNEKLKREEKEERI